jgi:hypothetical protein
MLSSLRNKIVAVVATLAMVLVPAVAPVAVFAATAPDNGAAATGNADIQGNLQCGTTLTVESQGGCTQDINTGTQTISDTIKKIVNIFSAIIGIVAVIMIIYGGFKYISSGGDSGNVTSAKNTIIYAVIGLIIVAMAQFIVQFVLGRIVPQT